MKILLAVSHDVIFKPNFLYKLILRLQGFKIVHILEVRNSNNRKNCISPLEFWGISGSVILGLIVILRKISSILPFLNFIRSMSTVKKVSALFNIPYKNIIDINSQESIELIRSAKPNVVISFQHQIFKNELLDSPGIIFINCHPSILPKYRGVKPIFWSMLNRDDEFGVTVHTMNMGIDCGDILSQTIIKRNYNWSMFQNYIAAYEISVDTIYDALKNISGKSKSLGKIDANSKYYSMPSKEDLILFKKNNKII